jgi:hypothetical protein
MDTETAKTILLMLPNDFSDLNALGPRIRNSGASAQTIDLYLHLLASLAGDLSEAQKQAGSQQS